MSQRRLLLAGLGATLLSGCGLLEKPRQVTDDGLYCFHAGKSRNRTCTSEPVPPQQMETDVKRFEPSATHLTVFVVRHRWGDAVNKIDVRINGGPGVVTVPESLVRARLAPGRHTLSLIWQGKEIKTVVEGRAGDVRFVEIVGLNAAWGSSYNWSEDDQAGARSRAQRSRLIAVRDAG